MKKDFEVVKNFYGLLLIALIGGLFMALFVASMTKLNSCFFSVEWVVIGKN